MPASSAAVGSGKAFVVCSGVWLGGSAATVSETDDSGLTTVDSSVLVGGVSTEVWSAPAPHPVKDRAAAKRTVIIVFFFMCSSFLQRFCQEWLPVMHTGVQMKYVSKLADIRHASRERLPYSICGFFMDNIIA